MGKETFSMYKNQEEMEAMTSTKKTKKKITLTAIPDGRFGMFKIIVEEQGGRVPKELSGLYTSLRGAEKAIDSYVKHTQEDVFKVLTEEEQKQKEEAARKDFEERMKKKEAK